MLKFCADINFPVERIQTEDTEPNKPRADHPTESTRKDSNRQTLFVVVVFKASVFFVELVR